MTVAIGQALTRKEDLPLWRGNGCFSDDMNLPGQAHAAMVRAPHALMPADRARFVGEAVAMGVAETIHAAQDAAERVVVEYGVKHIELPLTSERIWRALRQARGTLEQEKRKTHG